jgi:hypothetical protein
MEKEVVSTSNAVESSARKELVYISGHHFLIGSIILMNVLVGVLVWRYHNILVFRVSKAHNENFAQITRVEREIKNEVVKLEGAATWNVTTYAKARPWTTQE